jgi:hypothetical protein
MARQTDRRDGSAFTPRRKPVASLGADSRSMSRCISLAAGVAAMIASLSLAMSLAMSVSSPSRTLAADGGIPPGDVCASAAPAGDVWNGTVIADIQSAACPATAAENKAKTTVNVPPDMVMPFTTEDRPQEHQ